MSASSLSVAVERLPALRTAHVLFLDIVGFARLRTDEQVAAQQGLSYLVQSAPELEHARRDGEEFLLRPAGDGVALLFFRDLLSPVRCALQIAQEVHRSGFTLRMGIHTGPVSLIDDVNGNRDAAGDGIIQAQRVMDLGDGGHILLSEEAARVLLKVSPWPQYLRDLGRVRVKHGQEIHVYNLYGRLDGPFCGNNETPTKVKADGQARRAEQRIPLSVRLEPYRRTLVLAGILALIVGGAWSVWTRNPLQVRAAAATLSARLRPAPKTAPKLAKKPARRAEKPRRRQEAARPRPQGREALVPTATVVVPSLRRLSFEEAVALGESCGLSVVEKGPRIVKPGFEEGTVFFQSPSPGHKTQEGKRVVVRVAGWPREKPVAEEPQEDSSGDSLEVPVEE